MNNLYSKPFSAKVSHVEERTMYDGQQYSLFVLNQSTTKRRTSKILALAYGDIKELVKDILKVVKVTVSFLDVMFDIFSNYKPSRKNFIQFPPETFSCKPKDKRYASPSTCEYDLVFEFKSKFIWEARSVSNTSKAGNTNNKSCSLKEGKLKISGPAIGTISFTFFSQFLRHLSKQKEQLKEN